MTKQDIANNIEALKLTDGDILLVKSPELFEAMSSMIPEYTRKLPKVTLIADFSNKGVEVLNKKMMYNLGYIKVWTESL